MFITSPLLFPHYIYQIHMYCAQKGYTILLFKLTDKTPEFQGSPAGLSLSDRFCVE